ncbi:MAG: CotH kinase family protein [Saprospiraceae bacterium]
MTDSYGDGWNGGQLEIFINEESIGFFAAEEFGSFETFEVCQDDQIDLVYSSGDYENENQYQLFDGSGLVVFQDGPDPEIGDPFSGLGDCESMADIGAVPCTAIPLDTMNCLIGDNTDLLNSGLNPGCADYQGNDIWFEFTVPPSGNYVINTQSTGEINDTGLALWTGESCTGLTLITCDDDGGSDYFSLTSQFNQEPGSTVYAQVWAYGGGADGTFEICLSDLGTVNLEFSELPIVDIHTLGQEIVDEPKINALMRVMYNGPGSLTYVTDSANQYYGTIGIEIRGNTSADYPQKPFGIETRTELGENNNVPLLGMPAENDWVLLSNYNDKSFMRNILAQHLFEEMGNYAPRAQLCEVLIDSVYQGIYLIGEKLKRDANRIDIAKVTLEDNEGDEVTGGYIIKSDNASDWNSWQTNYSPIDHPEIDIRLMYVDPKPEVITDQQKDYIAAYIDSMETAMYSDEFFDENVGYRKYLDVPSFIDYFLVNEVSRNNDGFKKSRFYHKDKASNGGKLKAGATWDFDWAWKNIFGCSIFEATDGSGFAHQINDCFTDNNAPGWYVRMLQDTLFTNELRCEYDTYRMEGNILDTEYLNNYIDSIAALVENAQDRHFQKWPVLGIGGPAPEVGEIPATFEGEIENLKSWIALRLAWLDDNIPGTCHGEVVSVAENRIKNVYAFPNPSSGAVQFEGIRAGSEIEIFTNTGQKISQEISNSIGYSYRFSESGIYLVRFLENGIPYHSEKVVIEK